ncbi:hypothetical protein [Marivita sp. S2033]|uniref:hypothetical protein n=1 Tax=Marivita sp. S2033 TaxID=3373187 RepID=UPI003981D296
MANSKYVYVKRDEIAAINDLLADLRSKIDIPPKHPMQAEFAKICLGKKFNAKAALPILLDNTESNGVFKNFLFAGFCGCVVDPTDNVHSHFLMELEAKRHIVRSEGLYEIDDDEGSDGLDIIARYILTGEDFDQDIFHPLGGNIAVLYTGSEYDIENFLSADTLSIQSISYYLNILRTMQDIEVSGDKYALSKNRVILFADKAIKIRTERLKKEENQLKEELKKGRNETQRKQKKAEWVNKMAERAKKFPHFPSYLQRRSKIHEIWSRNTESLALLHAAAHVRVSQKRTLLDTILTADFDPEMSLPKLREWIGKAVYFSTTYLSQIGDAGQSEILNLASELVEPIEFRARKLHPFEEGLVREVITKPTKSRT